MEELVKCPHEAVSRHAEVVVVEGDGAVPRVPGHIHHLAGVQEAGRQQGQGQVGLDEPPPLHAVQLLQRLVVLRVKVIPSEGVKLEEGKPVPEQGFAALQVEAMGHLPHQLLGPGGPALGIGHYPDIIRPNADTLNIL